MSLYRHIGAAVAFSPRLEALLAEAAHRASVFEARLSLIHAGPHTPESEARLCRAMHSVGVPEDVDVHWMTGAPAPAILRAADAQEMDLIIAGALEKEKPLRYYLGSVAHQLVREAPCSLMLLTNPQIQPEPVRNVVFVAEYTEQSLIALTKTIRLAEKENAEQIFAIRVLTQYGTAMVLSDGVRKERARAYESATRSREEALLRDMVHATGGSRIPIHEHVIEGHTGFIAARFAREHRADLLVIPSTESRGHFFERIIPSDMEWVLREIPCNLWVVRERLG